MSGKSSDKRCPCCKLGWDREGRSARERTMTVMDESGVKFRVIFLLLVQSLPPDSPINMFWLGRCARLTQSTWLTRHPRTILYPPSSLTRSHKLLSLLSFVKFGVLELWPCCSHVPLADLGSCSQMTQHDPIWPWFGQRDSALVEIHQKAEIRGLKAYCALQSVSLYNIQLNTIEYNWAQELEDFQSKISPY